MPALPAGLPVASPCIGVCTLDDRGMCQGCFRTIGQIAEWSAASEARRRAIVEEAAARRQAAILRDSE